MSRNSSAYIDQRRWAEHRRRELTAKEATQAVADLLCVVCGGRVVGGVCDTCDSRYENGQRVREWAQCPTCERVYRIKDGHQCVQVERE